MKIRESDKWAYYQLFNDIDLEGKKLLDIGGGKATVGFYYSSKLGKYVCVDSYEGHGNPKENFNIVLKMIRDRDIKNMEIKKMDLKKFHKENSRNKFDIVLISNVLHHIFPSPALLNNVVEYLNLAARFLKAPGGLLLIREVMPINISQVICFLNKNNVNFSTKQFPSFWLRAINETNFFNNFIYKYHIPFKLRLSYSFIKNLKLVRFLASLISTSSYIIKAQRNEYP